MPQLCGVLPLAVFPRVMTVVCLLCAGCAQVAMITPVDESPVVTAPVELDAPDSFHAVPGTPVQAIRQKTPQSRRQSFDARLLVLSADGREPVLSALTRMLDTTGTPYTVWVASEQDPLSPQDLASGNHGFFQGVLVALPYRSVPRDGGAVRGLSTEEWQVLWDYQARFDVREVAFLVPPGAEMGLELPGSVLDLTSTSLDLHLTEEGRRIFADVASVVPLKGVHAYAVTTHPGIRPLLIDNSNHTLAGIRAHANSTETMFVGFDAHPGATHFWQLSRGILEWVTQGVWLGERRTWLHVQVDGVFLASVTTDRRFFRLTGEDLKALRSWQSRIQTDPRFSLFKLELVANPAGMGEVATDGLLRTGHQLHEQFRWVLQPFVRGTLDDIDKVNAVEEIRRAQRLRNRDLARQDMPLRALALPFTTDGTSALLSAVQELGVHTVVTDGPAAYPEEGAVRVPRRHTNLFSNVSTPSQWVELYNEKHRSHWGRDLTYQEILTRESEVMVLGPLSGDMTPFVFHQANLRAYDGTRSLVSDLLDRVLERYAQLMTLPLQCEELAELGWRMEKRARLTTSGIRAVIRPEDSLMLQAERTAVVPVTGIRTGVTDHYANVDISFVPVPAGRSVTFPLP